MRERDLIATYFAPLAAAEPGSFSLTDDAAQLFPPPGYSLIVTTDSVIEGTHVPMHASGAQMAQKLVRRNLSDLAAMGAMPWRYTLNVHLPLHVPDAWIADFASMLQQEQQTFGMVLAGGDTSRGGEHIHLTMTCMGLLQGPALTRSGAQAGDDLYVSGTIGDAALGLAMLQEKMPLHEACVQHYERPEPRLALGAALQNIASSAMDISDGLLLDLTRLCAASNVGAVLQQSSIPLSHAAQQLLQIQGFWDYVLTVGDDYELLFTAPIAAREAVQHAAQHTGVSVTRTGSMTSALNVRVLDKNNAELHPTQLDWEY